MSTTVAAVMRSVEVPSDEEDEGVEAVVVALDEEDEGVGLVGVA